MICAAFALCTPCSAKTTPAISGLSRGAKNTNHPWSRRFFVVRAAARPVLEMTCAVPVLPQTSLPSMRVRRPVPLGELTTFHMPSRIADSFSGLTSTTDCGGGAGTGFHCVPSETALRMCGVMRTPPLPSVAA